ncbi:DUF302 domain-containing protein [Nocardia vinacea]|uniref:DUF302 domain-containing protein n=1 Tax=Nocardia vinacea TaxID=96468 RepID=UPI0002E9318E|nr:DUF302 domain-containing protein [Nocardia vinacea]
MSYRVEVVESNTTTVLELRRSVRGDHAGDDIGAGMHALYEMATHTGLVPAGPPSTTYLGMLGPGVTTEVDFGLPVTGAVLDGTTEQVVLRRPEPTLCASIWHHGDYQHIGDAYRALDDWIRSSDYQPMGPPTEVFVVAPDAAVRPGDLVTEIRRPIAAALAVRVRALFADAVSELRKALAEKGFGIITEIDVRATLHARLDVRMNDYLILGACDPILAQRALTADPRVGLLLPCNVVVRTDGDTTLVEAVDPVLLLCGEVLHHTDQPELRAAARDARDRLAAALATVEKRLEAAAKRPPDSSSR